MKCKDVDVYSCLHCRKKRGNFCWFSSCQDVVLGDWKKYYPNATCLEETFKYYILLFSNGTVTGIKYFRAAIKVNRPELLESFDRLAILL